jgi:twitching motility protein PilI
MSAVDSTPAVSAQSGVAPADPQWLPPSAALGRFQPRQSVVLGRTKREEERVRYGFRIGSLGLLIKPGTGSEVLPMVPISAIPNCPPWLLGVINLRSNLVPVFDLRLVCALDDTQSQEQFTVLVLDKADAAVGMIIEGYPKALTGMSAIPRLPQLPTVLRGHVSAGYMRSEELWLEFDHDRFFASLNEAAGVTTD